MSTPKLNLPKLNLRRWKQVKLARASGLNFSTISRMLSPDPTARRAPTLDSLQKLQAGILKLTRRHYSLEQVAAAISEATAPNGATAGAA